MGSQLQPPAHTRIAKYFVVEVEAGTSATFTGPGQVVKRVIVPAGGTGYLNLTWDTAPYQYNTFYGAIVLEPDGQYNYDAGFTVDASGVSVNVQVELVSLV